MTILPSKNFGNKSTVHGCWTLDFFASDIKLQAIYKVVHTSNYDGHISKYVCKIGKYNQKCVSLKRTYKSQDHLPCCNGFPI